MGIKTYKPTSPARRQMTSDAFDEITATKPEKSLTASKKRISGRNNKGRITVRRRGGGHKRKYRIIDFKRNKFGVPGRVATIEYDPNRSAYIALINYLDGEKRYILCPKGLKVDDMIVAGEDAEIAPGNAMPLRCMPVGSLIHNIELTQGKGGQLARSAGVAAQLAAKEGIYVTIKLPSGEMRLIHRECIATIGEVGNSEHNNINIGKAGRNRWLGKRPKVRGVVMNPVDHPHGGGEGKSSGGRHPVSPWGKPTKGAKTRKTKRTGQFIVRRRNRK